MFPFDPLKTSEKPLVFWCFQGDQKGTLGRNILSCAVHWVAWKKRPTNIYLFKVNNRNTIKRCEICSKLKIKTPERRKPTLICQWKIWIDLSNFMVIWMLLGIIYCVRNIFRKTSISYPLICTCAYHGVRNVSFLLNLHIY